jgi:hypothetical protein
MLQGVGWVLLVMAMASAVSALLPYVRPDLAGAVGPAVPGPRSAALSQALMGVGMLATTAIGCLRAADRVRPPLPPPAPRAAPRG